jgi:Tol biopolymer transport system component
VTAAWTEDRLVPSWSPDGTQITYIRRSDTTDVYVADVVTGSERQVTQGLMALFPVWSPEEDWIAFVTEENALYVVRADGSELRQLSDQASFDPPTWSPDGERLAFINSGYEISIVDLNGSEEEIISDFRDEFNGQTFYVTWSPTENQIAAEVIVRNPPTRVNLFLVDAETGTASPLSPREYQATWTSWTPSGEFLLFDRIQSSAALQESEIYRVNVHSGENILLAIGGKAVSNAG